MHIYRGDDFVGRFDIENQLPMDGELSRQILKYLEDEIFERMTNGKSDSNKKYRNFIGAGV